MLATATQFIRRLRASWPGSPILGKEMRVTSRRGWLYGLRLAYVAMLGLFAAVIWEAATKGLTASTAAVKGADIGKGIVSSILWFQFYVAQGITIVFMSSSINGEIRRRTLPLLLTTPLDCFQIVREKALGGLFYVMVLLACCLPLLSIMRVFGGVPIGYIVSSLAVTATACLFAGAVSAYFSTLMGNPILASLLAAGAVAAFDVAGYTPIAIPLDIILCAGMFTSREFGDGRAKRKEASSGLRYLAIFAVVVPCIVLWQIILYAPTAFVFPPLCPPHAMDLDTRDLMVPGKLIGLTIGLGVHCALMVAVSFGVLRRCSTRLYRLARTRIWGVPPVVREHPMIDPEMTQKALANLDLPPVAPEALAEINRLAARPMETMMTPVLWVERRSEKAAQTPGTWRFHRERMGSPLLWKDTRRILPRNHQLTFWLYFVPLCLMFTVSWVSLAVGAVSHVAWHATMLCVYVVAGTFLTAIFSATAIGAERQARTWPILLTTTLSSRHILWAKSASVMYRALPAWLPLLAHVAVCTAVPLLHPLALVGAVLVAAWIHVFLCGSGFYFSMVLRGTSRPLIANLALAGALWIFVPVLAPLAGGLLDDRQTVSRWSGPLANLGALTPVGQIAGLMDASPGLWSLDRPSMPEGSRLLWSLNVESLSYRQESFCNVLLALAIYGSLGGMLHWLALRRFRKNAFA